MLDRSDAHTEHEVLLRENSQLKEASARARRASDTYAHIAYALARDYTDLFYVDMDAGEFTEYVSDDERGMLVESRHADGFFESCEVEAGLYVHPDDRDAFVRAMKREFLEDALDRSGEFEMSYRRLKDGRSFWVQMRVSRMRADDSLVVVAVSDIDELVTRRREEERVREERVVYARLQAITGNFIAVYVVNPESEHYREFSLNEDLSRGLGLGKEGGDFFRRARATTRQIIRPEDLGSFLAVFTKDNVISRVERDGIFTLGYRITVGGRLVHVQLKAARVTEDTGVRLVIGLNDVDAQVRQQEEVERLLMSARAQANVDALTGVRNRHAYLEAEERLNAQITQRQAPPFAIVVLDVNDLKQVNDASGHQAGDEWIRGACGLVCDVFKHSPVFRVGGDEFAVIAQGTDYDEIDDRLWDVSVHNEEALRSGGVVIACGMARYEEGDTRAADVFDRADRRMYEDKRLLKEGAAR